MTPASFSTSGLRAQNRFGAWRSFHERVFEIVPKQLAGEFDAKLQFWTLGSFAMSRTTSPSVALARTTNHLKHDPLDHWLINYSAYSAHTTFTAGVSAEVPAGVPFLWSLGQSAATEYTRGPTHVDQIQFLLPRDAFGDIASTLDGALGSALNTPLGLLLGDYMVGLERHLDELTEADLPRLSVRPEMS